MFSISSEGPPSSWCYICLRAEWIAHMHSNVNNAPSLQNYYSMQWIFTVLKQYGRSQQLQWQVFPFESGILDKKQHDIALCFYTVVHFLFVSVSHIPNCMLSLSFLVSIFCTASSILNSVTHCRFNNQNTLTTMTAGTQGPRGRFINHVRSIAKVTSFPRLGEK